MSKIRVIVLIGLVSLFVFGCEKNQCSDIVPEIEFKSFEQFDDNTALLTLSFKDCDGDIGLRQSDSIAPYDYNLFMEYFEKQNDAWINIKPPIPYYYRIPILSNESDKSIEGDIEVTIASYYNPFSDFDTIKFQIHIIDRALNESNKVETNEIIVPN